MTWRRAAPIHATTVAIQSADEIFDEQLDLLGIPFRHGDVAAKWTTLHTDDPTIGIRVAA